MDPRIYQSHHIQSLSIPAGMTSKKPYQVADGKQAFKDQLQQALNQTHLKISKHAKQRLQERNISINDSQWKKIEDKVTQAKSMGINDSLVLMDHAALIISARNNTVVTAMDRLEAKSQIFTNINGTILLDD